MAPTIVIVPASFTPPDLYSDFEASLQGLGYSTRTIDLPSVGTRDSGKKPGSMSDDAAAISRVVLDLYDNNQAEAVVLLAHSYGGIPASESMKFISERNRAQEGKKGVSRIIYLAGIVLPVGISNEEMRKRPPPDYVTIEEDWITIDHAVDAPYALNDMPEEERLTWTVRMQQQSTASMREKATYPGYNDVRVDYISCTKDETLPLQGTQRILKVIEEGSGTLPNVHEFPGGHCPTMSQPQRLAQFVHDILS